MSDLLLIEASFFQLNAALASVDDAMFASQLQLTSRVLANAIEAAKEALNAARVNDIEFALNDVAGVVDELPARDANPLIAAIAMMRGDIETLKQQTAFKPQVLDAIHAFRSKLYARRTAIERQTFIEGPAPPLPHPPEELEAEAVVLQARIQEAGFTTPALDGFVDAPSSLTFYAIGEIIDELDVVTA